MNKNDKNLAHSIKMKFGTAPNSPTSYQLEKIKSDLQSIIAQGAIPTEKDWSTIVSKHCPDAGTYAYLGVDNSDLQTLLMLATKK